MSAGHFDRPHAENCTMIDPFLEDLLTLSEAARLLPGRPHTSTLWRWIHKGIKGCRLESIFVGGTRRTSKQALGRFFAATTAAADGTAPIVRTPTQREKAIAAAEKELAAAGI
jgi:hypothetical protein